MKIKFLGAAGTVTGSKYLLTTSSHRYLVDCGLFQGLKSLRERNWQDFDLDEQIDAVFLTHAHIDHTGYIPKLVASGFAGPIYCSRGTYELCKILLPDSGYLQEEEARYANLKGYSRHKPAMPLYTRDQAEESLKYFQPVDFYETVKVNDVRVTFRRAGHILGASTILFEAGGRKIVFSGDVGRYNDLIMPPPEPLPDADYLVLESTYGDRDHQEEDIMGQLAKIINEASDQGGTIVVPAFAVGRAQHMLHLIQKLKEKKEIPDIKTYLDSPMAIDATDLYCQYHAEHRLSQRDCALMCKSAIITKTPDESRAINNVQGPKIIISASGMASGGRVLHHLSQYLGDAKNVIVLVGFQAAGTRGRELLEGKTEIKIFGKIFPVLARIENLLSLSAHADSSELVRWLNESKLRHPQVFITHGEQSAALAMAKKIEDVFKWQVKVPKDKEEFDL
jgi:metallo-beta-lactamase family protein